MKNASLILNVVLAIAVAVLYFLHFSDGSSENTNNNEKKQLKEKTAKPKEEANSLPGEIVFVNYDSLLTNYKYVKEIEEDVAAEKLKLQGQLDYRMKQLENEVVEFQKKAQFMSQVEGEQKQMELMQKEQDLMAYRQQLDQKLLQLETEKAREVQTTIKDYLASIQEENGYAYILGTGSGSNVLKANSDFEITNEVIESLNEQYAAKQEETSTEKSKK